MRIPRKEIKLVFPEDSELHGTEITVRRATLGEYRAYSDKYPGKEATSFERVEYETRFFLSRIAEWNLEDDAGDPLPLSYEAFEANVPLEWARPLLKAFATYALGQRVQDDTEKKSESGEPTETTRRMEASLPMDVSR